MTVNSLMHPRMTSSALGLLALLACSAANADPIDEQRTWQQSYPVASETPQLLVRNIWGNVSVRSGAAREIVVTAYERRSAPNKDLLEKSKQRIRLDVRSSADGVSLVVDDPNRNDRRTDLCQGCRLEYQFEIVVPAGTQVDVGTITDGRVEVTGVRGIVSARNVNGPVAVSNASDCTNIESVNGALDVTFASAPAANCTMKTINGEITIGLPANAGLDAILSITHGEIDSEFEAEPIALPTKIDTSESDERNGFRIEQPAGVRLGGGGPTFTFASLNGDVRIRKNK